MNKPLDTTNITIIKDSSIQEAMQAIGNGGIGAAFVTDEYGRFFRLLTDGDIRRALLDGYGLQSNIDVIPYKEAIVVHQDTPVDDISKLFSEKIRLIPVLDDNEKVIDCYQYDKRQHISVAKPLIDESEIQLVNECLISGWVSSGGPFVKQFEKLVADYCGVEYGISCSSCTTGLHLSLLALGVGPGDEIIVPSLTFISTANAVRYTGAKPVFIDSDENTWNINHDLIENKITNKTKGIIPVHLYGQPAAMDEILSLADKYNLFVLEDAAEAQGATYKGKQVGSIGDVGVFSFFGNKIITTGEGGMIVTSNKEIAEKCQILRDHGMSKSKRYWHEELGYNYRMTNLQAALGVAQMSKLNKILLRKKEIAKIYTENLKTVPGIILPISQELTDNVYWLYTILVHENLTGFSSKELMKYLSDQSIDTRPIFPPIHRQPIYDIDMELPVSEKIANDGVSLPSSPEIRNDDIVHICALIKNYKAN